MDLAHALRLVGPSRLPGGHLARLAWAGSGGKTTLMFTLARQLAGMAAQGIASPVLVTTTTHLGAGQAKQAGEHHQVEREDDLAPFEGGLPAGIHVFTGPPTGDGRVSGLDGPALERLHRLADAWQAPLLVEADGSRRRPLKAPAAHEPAIPPWVDHVIVVAGCAGLGQPLDQEAVHRPEIFARLSGLSIGSPVTPAALGRVLAHPAGGLKNIPPGARRVALLNQADDPLRQGQAHTLVPALLGAYHATGITGSQARSPGEVFAMHERVAGILLAAGGAARLGRPKQLLAWKGRPFIRQVAETALDAGVNPVVVVTGAYAADVAQAVTGLPVQLAHNPDWEAGQSTSIATGLAALPAEIGAAMFLLADQPQVPVSLVRGLLELHAGTLSPLVAPMADGRRANPVLFDRATFPDLLALQGDTGGRALFSRYPVAWLVWHDPGPLFDVDTEEDYRKLLEWGEDH